MILDESIDGLAGLDNLGLRIVEQRAGQLVVTLERFQDFDPRWRDALLTNDVPLLLELLASLETRLGRRRWAVEYLVPLAETFGLRSVVEETLVRRCWKAGWFDPPVPARQKGRTIDDVLPQVRRVLEQTPDNKQRIQRLIQLELCRDETTARRVAEVFKCGATDFVKEGMAGRARGVVLASFQNRLLGLLHSSEHPCADDLLLLQRQVLHIERMNTQPATVLGMVRADIIALRSAFDHVGPGLWKGVLLRELPGSQQRLRYQAMVTDEIRALIVAALAEQRGCDETEAAALLDVVLHGGLASLIDWRCQRTLRPDARTLLTQQVDAELDEQLVAFHSEARVEIRTLVMHLQDAIEETVASFPLRRLLRDQPSSPFRRKFGRRFSFGRSRMLQRRRRRRLAGEWQVTKRARVRQRPQVPRATWEEKLLDSFIRRSGLSAAEAKGALRDLITYGAPGLLEETRRRAATDSRLVDYMYLLKLAHLDQSWHWGALIDRVRAYAQELGVAPPSAQHVIGIFNSLGKPRFWHGGQGEATATARQRSNLVLDVPRLFDTCLVFPVQLALPVLDLQAQAEREAIDVLLVMEMATVKPAGCWAISLSESLERAIGLAIYQSFWHPGALEWPLHGAPHILRIPSSLATSQLTDIERAAKWLMMEVERVPEQRWSKFDVVDQLKGQFPSWVMNKLVRRPTVEQVQSLLLQWLYEVSFPRHQTAPIPASIRSYGVALPGHRSMAAGWLLPTSGQVIAVPGGVATGNVLYTHPSFTSSFGVVYPARAFPIVYAGMEQGIFVEMAIDGKPSLMYFVRSAAPAWPK